MQMWTVLAVKLCMLKLSFSSLTQHPHLRFFSLEKLKNYFWFLAFSLGMDQNNSFNKKQLLSSDS